MIGGMNEANGAKKLVRPREGRMLAGVCAGLGDYFGIDANIVRLVLAALVLFGGLGALIYVVAWAVVPEEGEETSIVENLVNKNRDS
jgi:phage shock protein C